MFGAFELLRGRKNSEMPEMPWNIKKNCDGAEIRLQPCARDLILCLRREALLRDSPVRM